MTDTWNQRSAPDDPNDLVLRIEKMEKALALCREAVVAIKANPDAAKDEKYAFLFSAASLQMNGKVRSSADMTDRTSFEIFAFDSALGSGARMGSRRSGRSLLAKKLARC